MIHFFGNVNSKVFAVQTAEELSTETISKLNWLFGNQPKIEQASLDAFFVGISLILCGFNAVFPGFP